AVQDERWHVQLLEISREVRLRESLDAIEHAFKTRLHSLHPERIPQPLRDRGARPVGPIERRAEILEELRAVGQYSSTNAVEHIHRQATRIARRLQHQRRHSANQYGLGNALRAVTADITRDF